MIPRMFHKYVRDDFDKFLTVGYPCLVGAESVILNKSRSHQYLLREYPKLNRQRWGMPSSIS
jgi:hypothetical protein